MRAPLAVALLSLAACMDTAEGIFGSFRKETSVTAGPRSDLGCSTVGNSQWQRFVLRCQD